MIEEMDENEYMHELSKQIVAVTQIPIEEAAERVHETIAVYNKILTEERCKK